MKKIIIVGGGFAGLRVAKKLSKYPKLFDVTLINESTSFRYCPALYRSATGLIKRQSIIPIKNIISRYLNINFVVASASSIDRNKKTITTADNKVFDYDYAVLALGVVTTYFNIPGLEQYSFSIKTPEGLDKLKNHLHETLLDEGMPDANYVIVGAGPTGVELSAALASYLRKIVKKHRTRKHAINIELIEAAPRVLPMMSEKVSKQTAKRLRKLKIKLLLGQAVKGETHDNLTVGERLIPSKTVIWTSGVTNNPFFKNNQSQFQFNERGKVVVDEHMMVDDHVFVLGDNAATPYAGLAQIAVNDANYTAKALHALCRGHKLRAYKQTRPVYVVPAGKKWSVLQNKNFVISGRIPNMIRGMADLIGYTDIMGLKKALMIWRSSEKTEETCRVCKT